MSHVCFGFSRSDLAKAAAGTIILAVQALLHPLVVLRGAPLLHAKLQLTRIAGVRITSPLLRVFP